MVHFSILIYLLASNFFYYTHVSMVPWKILLLEREFLEKKGRTEICVNRLRKTKANLFCGFLRLLHKLSVD